MLYFSVRNYFYEIVTNKYQNRFPNTVSSKFLQFYSLLDAINYGVYSSWLTVIDEGRIALHQKHRELLEEVGCGRRLLLPSLPGQGASKVSLLRAAIASDAQLSVRTGLGGGSLAQSSEGLIVRFLRAAQWKVREGTRAGFMWCPGRRGSCHTQGLHIAWPGLLCICRKVIFQD